MMFLDDGPEFGIFTGKALLVLGGSGLAHIELRKRLLPSRFFTSSFDTRFAPVILTKNQISNTIKNH